MRDEQSLASREKSTIKGERETKDNRKVIYWFPEVTRVVTSGSSRLLTKVPPSSGALMSRPRPSAFTEVFAHHTRNLCVSLRRDPLDPSIFIAPHAASKDDTV